MPKSTFLISTLDKPMGSIMRALNSITKQSETPIKFITINRMIHHDASRKGQNHCGQKIRTQIHSAAKLENEVEYPVQVQTNHCNHGIDENHMENIGHLINELSDGFLHVMYFIEDYNPEKDSPTILLLCLLKDLLSTSDLNKDKNTTQQRLFKILFGVVPMPDSLVPKWKVICEWARYLRYTNDWNTWMRFGLSAFNKACIVHKRSSHVRLRSTHLDGQNLKAVDSDYGKNINVIQQGILGIDLNST
ncbi:hypothetical protein F4703DRAFT_1837955 [Phycomyces blakesleeanus]